MYIQLVRESFTDKATEGKIFVNGEFECYTLEDMDRKLELPNTKKVYGETAIPRGSYRLIITMSTRFKRETIEVLNVPGFTGIRIHSGNKSEDTEGCVLVGSSNDKTDDNWIGNSKVAYDKLHQKVKEALVAGELVTLEIV